MVDKNKHPVMIKTSPFSRKNDKFSDLKMELNGMNACIDVSFAKGGD